MFARADEDATTLTSPESREFIFRAVTPAPSESSREGVLLLRRDDLRSGWSNSFVAHTVVVAHRMYCELSKRGSLRIGGAFSRDASFG